MFYNAIKLSKAGAYFLYVTVLWGADKATSQHLYPLALKKSLFWVFYNAVKSSKAGAYILYVTVLWGVDKAVKPQKNTFCLE